MLKLSFGHKFVNFVKEATNVKNWIVWLLFFTFLNPINEKTT